MTNVSWTFWGLHILSLFQGQIMHLSAPPTPQPHTRYTWGSQRDVVYLGWPIAPSYRSPKARWWAGLRALSQWVQLCTWSPNKLRRSNLIFNLWWKPKKSNLAWFWVKLRLNLRIWQWRAVILKKVSIIARAPIREFTGLKKSNKTMQSVHYKKIHTFFLSLMKRQIRALSAIGRYKKTERIKLKTRSVAVKKVNLGGNTNRHAIRYVFSRGGCKGNV